MSGSTFTEVAAFTYSNDHQIGTTGNYRATPLETLSGETSASPLRLRDEDVDMPGIRRRRAGSDTYGRRMAFSGVEAHR